MSEQRAITVKRQSLDLISLGNALASSGYFQDTRDQAQAIVKVLAGQELGVGPIASMTGIHIIQGKPTYSANVMAAVIKNHPSYDYEILELDNDKCTLQFLRDGQPSGPASQFTMKDANQAGLTKGKNSHSWQKYPRNMLFARALSNLARWSCPDAFAGIPPYTPEELGAPVNEDGELISEIEPVYIEAPETSEIEIEPESQQKQAVKAFYAEALSRCELEVKETRLICQSLGISFDPTKANDILDTLCKETVEPSTMPSLIVAANRLTNDYYHRQDDLMSNQFHIKGSVEKMNPDIVWPNPGNPKAWEEHLRLAVEYATNEKKIDEQRATEQNDPLFPMDDESIEYAPAGAFDTGDK